MKIIKNLTGAVILVVIFYGLAIEMKNQDFIRLQTVRVIGASPETETRLQEKLKGEIGKPILGVSLTNAFKEAVSDPWVDQAEVSRKLPHTLEIDVVEKKPFAVLSDGKGKFQLIDDNASVIDKAKLEQVSEFPILMGFGEPRKIPLRQQAIALLKALPEQGPLSRGDVSDISFDDERGFQITLAKTGTVVEVGRENIPLHLDRARKVAQYLDQHHINAARIDSDYAKKVLVKLKRGR